MLRKLRPRSAYDVMAVFGHRIGFGDGAPLRRAGTAVALMAVVTLGAAAPAQAAPGSDTTVVETLFRPGAGGSATVMATCPTGRRVVGGGAGPASNGAFGTVVQVSGPVDATGNTADTNTGDVGRGWLASVKDDGQDRQYAVFALCSATSDATIAQSNIPAGANAIGTGDSTCPNGTRVVGGGVGTTGPTVGSEVALSGPTVNGGVPNSGDVANRWLASVINTGQPQTYRVFALCSASSDATIAEASFSFGNEDPKQATKDAVARCPAGQRALGGGIITTATTVGSIVRRSAPQVGAGFATSQSAVANGATVDTDVSRRWAAAVLNEDEVRTYKVLALCAADEPLPPPNNGTAAGSTGPNGTNGTSAGQVLAAASNLAFSSPTFAAESSGPSATDAKRKRPRGTKVSFQLNQAVIVRFTVTRQAKGRKAKRGKKTVCAKPTRRNRKGKPCTRTITLKGSFSRNGVAGTNSFHFTGRLNGNKLKPGRYRLVATPGAGGTNGKPTSSAFRIVR